MKRTLLYLVILFLASCSVASNNDRYNTAHSLPDHVPEKLADEYSTHYLDTTYTINNRTFRISTTDLSVEFVLLVASHNSEPALTDTINSAGLANIEFPDFNSDGYLDIKLTYLGNSGINFLYLFDQTSSIFKNVKGFDDYPEATQLKANPEFYYSYHKAGCADMNWISDLFRIENFKTIKLGQIHGQGCEAEEAPQMIEIFKMQQLGQEKRELVEKHSYIEMIPDHIDKWAFIEKYWSNKHNMFK
jgi:hypothetical protein